MSESPTAPARCWVLHAFDVARAISLPACRAALPTQEVADVRRPQWPHLFGLDQRPLVWALDPVELVIGGAPRQFARRAIIYDFGNVSVALRCEVDGPPEAWRELAIALDADHALERVARDVIDAFVSRAGAAISDRRASDDVEVFKVFHVDAVPGASATAWLTGHARLIAQVLRADAAAFSGDEVAEALGRRLSYAEDDVVVVDDTAALIVDRRGEDTLAVLDFANCERLSLRVLDDDLDRAVASASALLRTRAGRLRALLSPWGRDVRRLTQLTFDASAELEAVENAVKLTGDHYLARIYRLAVDRFGLRIFLEGIGRKLSNLWNIQKVFIDQAATRRSEWLEWIIIALIAYEIVQAVQ